MIMNNRELVSLLFIGFVVVFAFAAKSIRPTALDVLRQLLASKLAIFLGIYLGTITAAVWLMAYFGFWDASLIGSTLLWFLLVGFVWFINIGDAGKDPDFFKHRLLEALGIGAVLECFLNLEVLPLVLEFLLQAFLLFVVGINVVASREAQYRAVARLTSGILIAATLALFTYTVMKLIQDWDVLDFQNILDQLLLPIWLTLAAIPSLYLFGLVAGYESLFMRLSHLNDRSRPPLAALAGVVTGLGGSLVDINSFGGRHTLKAAEATSFKAARATVKAFKHDRRADQAARAAARQRLVDNAGRTGTDNAGLQLDRREFAATKEALRWLATCHMGWYQREDRPDIYRADLLDVLFEFSQQGLPNPHGIVMKVRKDGQAWYGYRTTPSGYVFGIGASEAPPSQWFWDGPKPPSGYPSKRSGWTSAMEPDRPEWRAEAPT
jgi:hypothetical protein